MLVASVNFLLQLFTECHLIQKLLDGHAINEEMYVEHCDHVNVPTIVLSCAAVKAADVVKATWVT